MFCAWPGPDQEWWYLGPDVGQFRFIWFSLGWHVAMVSPALAKIWQRRADRPSAVIPQGLRSGWLCVVQFCYHEFPAFEYWSGSRLSKLQGIWVSSNEQQKWPRKQLNRAKRTTFAWIRQFHKFHMSSTETNQPLRTQRGQRGRQTDSLSWFLHRLHARCVSPNKDSKTPTRKTHKKNSYKNTYNSHAAETTHMHAHTWFTVCVQWIKTVFLTNIAHQGQLFH